MQTWSHDKFHWKITGFKILGAKIKLPEILQYHYRVDNLWQISPIPLKTDGKKWLSFSLPF